MQQKYFHAISWPCLLLHRSQQLKRAICFSMTWWKRMVDTKYFSQLFVSCLSCDHTGLSMRYAQFHVKRERTVNSPVLYTTAKHSQARMECIIQEHG